MAAPLGSRLKEIRIHLRLSQDEFSKRLGVSQFTLSNYETGKRFPDSRFLARLKEVADVDLNWLIWGDAKSPGFHPGKPQDPELDDFLYWLHKVPMVRHAALISLEEIKYKHPPLFKDTDNKKEDRNKHET